MESKICSVCQLDIQLSEFTVYNKTKNKVRSYCKLCEKEKKHAEYLKNFDSYSASNRKYTQLNSDKIKEYKKQWYQENNEHAKAKSKITKLKYREANKDKIKQKSFEYAQKNKEKLKAYYRVNKEHIKARQKEYRKNNWDKVRQREKLAQIGKRREPFYRAKDAIRHRINMSIKNGGYTKKSKTYEILGCSFEKFKQHLESLFESWMCWENYGLYNGTPEYGWDIDHIIPLKNTKVEDELIKLNHYTNLQPLCSYYNRNIKRDITIPTVNS